MRNIFIAFTPYHILLSCGIALDRGTSDKNDLVAISEGVNTELLLQVLQEWNQEIFVNIYRLPGALYEPCLLRRRVASRKNARAVMHIIQGLIVDQVYTFNDARAESQAVLHYAKERNNSAKAIYVEDGAAAYSSGRRKARRRLIRRLGKLYYGSWWEKVIYLGGTPWIDEICVAFPELVRPELRPKRVTELPRSILLGTKIKGLVESISAKFAIDGADLKSLDAILIVAHSEFAKQIDGYREVIDGILASMKRQGLRVAAKYHPREPAGDYLSLSGREKVLDLPQSILVEAIYIQAPKNLKLVIGDISTSLYTAKWLLEEATVISIAPLLKYKDSHLLDVFRKLGIMLVDEKGLFDNVVAEQMSVSE